MVISLDDITKEFKLKRNKFCLDLVAYVRIFLMVHYKGPELVHLRATIPVSIAFEIFVLKFALNIILYFKQ